MAIIQPFPGLRPIKTSADKLAALPYDVMSSSEAKVMAADNPQSFLHITKPEIDLPEDIDHYDERVYAKGLANLNYFQQQGWLVRDLQPCFYVYRQVMENHAQIGLVAAASCEEYLQNKIKKHELTRPDKEDDRTKLINTLQAQTGPVFLTYKHQPAVDELIKQIVVCDPENDFTAVDGIRHTFWVVNQPTEIAAIQDAFKQIDYIYVADGHHRSAAASRVYQKNKQNNPSHTGQEPYNYFLAVIFPDNQMQILAYNRVVKDLNGLTPEEFKDRLAEKFVLSELPGQQAPGQPHNFSMYLAGQWYQLTARPEIISSDPVKSLDVSILQDNVLQPLLNIADPRTNERISFVGGIRGLAELERLGQAGAAVAFALYPTTIEQLIRVADNNLLMPPKSTWFEPKLRSGLVTYLLK